MKEIKNFEKLASSNDLFRGGFTSLNESQLEKIKGGTKRLDSNDSYCSNGVCTGSNLSDCTNSIKCS